ncbi:hypothetical protein HN51_021712, partial [Arachis hypogaea]
MSKFIRSQECLKTVVQPILHKFSPSNNSDNHANDVTLKELFKPNVSPRRSSELDWNSNTGIYIDKKGTSSFVLPRRSCGPKIPQWMPISFRPPEDMILTTDELACAAYIFGPDLKFQVNRDEVLVSTRTAYVNRESLATLIPGEQVIQDAIFIERMLKHKSFYNSSEITVPRISKFRIVEPSDLPQQRKGSNDCGIWVAQWMKECGWTDDFGITVSDSDRMMLAIDLVSKEFNMKKAVDLSATDIVKWYPLGSPSSSVVTLPSSRFSARSFLFRPSSSCFPLLGGALSLPPFLVVIHALQPPSPPRTRSCVVLYEQHSSFLPELERSHQHLIPFNSPFINPNLQPEQRFPTAEQSRDSPPPLHHEREDPDQHSTSPPPTDPTGQHSRQHPRGHDQQSTSPPPLSSVSGFWPPTINTA